MRLRRSILAVIALFGAVVVMLAGGWGVYVLTGNAIGALILSGCLGALTLALGILAARINDRVGDVMRRLRQAESTLIKSVQAGSAEVRREISQTHGAPATPPAQPPSPVTLLEQLIALPKSPVGAEHTRRLPVRRAPISEDDRKHWNESRQTATRLHLSDRVLQWKPMQSPAQSIIPVAVIADEFTYQSFEPEFESHRLFPSTWRETMAKAQPAMFFCESAWSGGNPPDRPWVAQIYGSARWPKDRRSVLFEILTYCRKNGIPTVFWNKEDPVHFGDRINDFIVTARLFDYVFTSAEECIPLYRRDAGVEDVGALPFAVQPSIFNPLGAIEPNDAAVFAGTWYTRYPERAAAASKIMDLVLSTGRDLVIYDRNYAHPRGYEYPERYQRFRRPAISFEQTAEAYRAHRFGITLNTITDSKTMFARRVFEMAACGNVVLSNTAAGVENFFGDSVIYADQQPERLIELDEQGYRRLQKDAIEVALNNTYTHRAQTILNAVGIESADPFAKPTLAVRVKTLDDFHQARKAQVMNDLPELLCLVTPDAEPLLLVTILRMALPDVVAESETRVLQGSYRSRSLLRAPQVFYWDPKTGEVPSTEWMRRAQLHMAYADNPVTPGNSDGVTMTKASADSVEGSLMTAAQFERYLCNGEPVDVLYEL